MTKCLKRGSISARNYPPIVSLSLFLEISARARFLSQSPPFFTSMQTPLARQYSSPAAAADVECSPPRTQRASDTRESEPRVYRRLACAGAIGTYRRLVSAAAAQCTLPSLALSLSLSRLSDFLSGAHSTRALYTARDLIEPSVFLSFTLYREQRASRLHRRARGIRSIFPRHARARSRDHPAIARVRE